MSSVKTLTLEFVFTSAQRAAIADYLGRHGEELTEDDLAKFVYLSISAKLVALDVDEDDEGDEDE